MNEKNYSPELNANNDPFGPTLYDTVKIDVFIVTRGYRPAFTKEDIEDMTHEAYIKVCENRKKAEGHPNVGGWIYKVCKNTVSNIYRKQHRLGPMVHLDKAFGDVDAPALDCSPILADNSEADLGIIYREFEQNFWRCYDELTPEQRSIISKLMEGTPYSKIAQDLDCTEGTARTKACRSRKALVRLGIAA